MEMVNSLVEDEADCILGDGGDGARGVAEPLGGAGHLRGDRGQPIHQFDHAFDGRIGLCLDLIDHRAHRLGLLRARFGLLLLGAAARRCDPLLLLPSGGPRSPRVLDDPAKGVVRSHEVADLVASVEVISQFAGVACGEILETARQPGDWRGDPSVRGEGAAEAGEHRQETAGQRDVEGIGAQRGDLPLDALRIGGRWGARQALRAPDL
jgi:hypothetical protein